MLFSRKNIKKQNENPSGLKNSGDLLGLNSFSIRLSMSKYEWADPFNHFKSFYGNFGWNKKTRRKATIIDAFYSMKRRLKSQKLM